MIGTVGEGNVRHLKVVNGLHQRNYFSPTKVKFHKFCQSTDNDSYNIRQTSLIETLMKLLKTISKTFQILSRAPRLSPTLAFTPPPPLTYKYSAITSINILTISTSDGESDDQLGLSVITRWDGCSIDIVKQLIDDLRVIHRHSIIS